MGRRYSRPVQRIAVIGCGGSGKTTLANRLSRCLGIEAVHLDSLYYGPGWSVKPTEEWEAIQRNLVSAERWIIDGGYVTTLPIRLAVADTAIYLDIPTRSCLWGVLKRRIRFRGRGRPEEGIYDRITWEFLFFICSFRRKFRPRILALLPEAPNIEVICLTSRREARRFIASL